MSEERWEKVIRMAASSDTEKGHYAIDVYEPSGKPITKSEEGNRKVDFGINEWHDRVQFYVVIEYSKD